jgi:hypothetical protein
VGYELLRRRWVCCLLVLAVYSRYPVLGTAAQTGAREIPEYGHKLSSCLSCHKTPQLCRVPSLRLQQMWTFVALHHSCQCLSFTKSLAGIRWAVNTYLLSTGNGDSIIPTFYVEDAERSSLQTQLLCILEDGNDTLITLINDTSLCRLASYLDFVIKASALRIVVVELDLSRQAVDTRVAS